MSKYLLLLTLAIVILFPAFALATVPEEAGEYFRLSFLSPDIRNTSSLFILQDEPDGDRMIKREEFEKSYFGFAFLNYRSFQNALNDFLTVREVRNSFLDYSVVDRSISGRLQASLMAGVDYQSDFEEQYIHLYRGVQVRGNIYNRLVFWGEWWAGRFQGDLDYAEANSPLIKGFFKTHQNPETTYTNLNKIYGRLSYLFDFGNVSLGRGTHLIGDNIGGSTILNDAVNDYGYFSSEITFGKLRLSFLHATLIPDVIEPAEDYDYQDKYLVLRQINYMPLPQLDLYFGEQVIYANRGIDPSYLLPHIFYRITEHNLQDRDNVQMYAGASWRYRDFATLYGSLIIGELRKKEIFSDWWGNKYALQGGGSLLFAEGLLYHQNEAVRTTLEFTAVRPWMYTHKTIATPFSHDGIGLGFPEGSNLIQTAGEIVFPLIPSLTLNQFVSFTKQGSVGNSFSINYEDRPSDTAKWLEGETTDRWLSRTVLFWHILAHHRMRAGMEFRRQDNESWRKTLVFGYQARY